jgi:hypothetical protein
VVEPVVLPEVVPVVVLPLVVPEVVVPDVVPVVLLPPVVPDVVLLTSLDEVVLLVVPEVEPPDELVFSEAVHALNNVSDEHSTAPVNIGSHLEFVFIGKNGK